jgi:hypothetical protein
MRGRPEGARVAAIDARFGKRDSGLLRPFQRKGPAMLRFLPVLVLFSAAAAHADEGAKTLTALDCYAVKDNAERLSCYDGVVAKLMAEREASLERRESVTKAFGGEDFADKDALEDIERMARISSAVASHKVNANGMVSLTLANGQVWRQIDGDRRIRALKADVPYTVEIRRLMLGRYEMKIEPAGSTIRVERTK